MNALSRLCFFSFFILLSGYSYSYADFVTYALLKEPIDVVIPAIEKDLETLDLCIEGIKKNCNQIRRVIVVSAKPLTDKAEWFDEKKYPFSKKKVALQLCKRDKKRAKQALAASNSRVGWYFQQLLKLYAPLIIPQISSNVLVLDSDTIFVNKVTFMDDNFEGLYNTSPEYHLPYFEHARKLLPSLKRIDPDLSGIVHHMLFQRAILDDLFSLVEERHRIPFWKAFCRCTKTNEFSGASEYEIYFNFIFSRTKQVHRRNLTWTNSDSISKVFDFQAKGYHYVSCHTCLRQ